MKQIKLQKVRSLVRLSMSSNKHLFILPIVFTAMGSILGSLNPYIIGLAITELSLNIKDIAAGVPGAAVNKQYILMIVIALSVSTILRQVLTYLAGYMILCCVV